ncbi:MAG TPA: ribonuclease E activity regulator RraA [Burkholderiales bacterium]|nr:ribonuclease E activity regulator RraA [Burkholderiales bacterium]
MSFKTADLCDHHQGKIRVVSPRLQSYGGNKVFSGRIATVKVHEDNVPVRSALSQPGMGKVLVVDGDGSLRCALVGDQLAELALKNNWAGIVVYGCIRDSEAIGQMPIGVLALNTHPQKSLKKGAGEVNIPVNFGGVTFAPDHYLYADADGIVVSEKILD